MSQLLGHADVQTRFSASMRAGNLHHAWLLYGLKGIGKHTLAEKLAGFVMCDSGAACGACHGCKMLSAASHPDVFRLGLIEGKRDLNIAQVREVLGFLALSGAESGRRVVILDDAERLNNQAANALLKGLEEPTAGSVLLIVCSDLERLPATVRSRCMLQPCAPLSDADVRQVIKQQQPPVDDAYLDLAVDLAAGAAGAVSCLQDAKIAQALLNWQQLVGDIVAADIGRIEAWVSSNVKLVPHALIIQILAKAVYPRLQQACGSDAFQQQESVQQALQLCVRWPGDVLRHSLRAGPALLACILQLRVALRA